MKTRILALLMALCMLMALCACGGTASTSTSEPSQAASAPVQENTETTAQEPAEASVAEPDTTEALQEENAEDLPLTAALKNVDPISLPITEEDVSFTIWMAAPGTISSVDDLANSNNAFAALQERTGVKITFQMGNFFTQSDDFNLMAAAGNYPEIMNGAYGLYSGGPDAAVEEEIFFDMTDLMEEYAPHYYALITSNETLLKEVSTPEGKLVTFYSLYDDSKYGLGDKGYLIRLDYLNDLGLDMPTTYDQLYTALTAFKEEKGASGAMTLPTSGMNDFVMGGFGVGATFYAQDGTIKFGPMEDGYREYLEMINQWYSEGLIYQDFYCFDNEIMFDGTDLIGSGDVCLYYNETGTMVSYAEYSSNPNFLVKGIAPVSKEEGGTIYMFDFTPSYVDNSRWLITTNCDEPEIAMQLADYLYTEEGILLANYGVEDITFQYADNEPVFTDMIMNNPDGYVYRDALALYTMDGVGTVYNPLRGASSYTAEQLSSWDDWTNANLDYSRALPDELLNADEKSEYSSLYSDIETFLEEAIIKYILGDYSFDSYDTDFVGQLEAMNIQDCIDLYQQAYDRYIG